MLTLVVSIHHVEMRMLINGAIHVCGFIVSCPLMYDIYIGGVIASPMIFAGEIRTKR